MTASLIFKPYIESYWDEIAELFQECFGQAYSRKLWEWKYQKNPFGLGRIMTAWRDECVIGQYAAYPVLYKDCDGRILQAQHISDVMIAPGARGGGVGRRSVLARLTRAFYEDMCQDKDFNYGCPMIKHMRLGKLVLDYHDVGPVMMWERPVVSRPKKVLAENFGGICRYLGRSLRGFKVIQTQGINEDWPELTSKVNSQYGFLVQRNNEYLSWRYAQPDKQYHFYEVRRAGSLVLWAVVEERVDGLVIGDMLFDLDDDVAFRCLVDHLTRKYGSCERICLWGGAYPKPLAAHLCTAGFLHRQVDIPVHLAASVFRNVDGILELFNNDRYYTMADFDLF